MNYSFTDICRFYKNNIVLAAFVVANLVLNTYFSITMISLPGASGMFLRAGIALFAIGVTIGMPLIGMAASLSMKNRLPLPAVIICLSWVFFGVIDVGMSYMASAARFETSAALAARQAVINEVNQTNALNASRTVEDCIGWKNCNSQERMAMAERSADKLASAPVAWSPQSFFPKWFVDAMIFGIAIGSSLGGSIMGFVLGLTAPGMVREKPEKKQPLRTAA